MCCTPTKHCPGQSCGPVPGSVYGALLLLGPDGELDELHQRAGWRNTDQDTRLVREKGAGSRSAGDSEKVRAERRWDRVPQKMMGRLIRRQAQPPAACG